MNIKIDGKDIKHVNQFTVSKHFDSFVSAWSADFNYNPKNQDHIELFKPLQYRSVQIFHKGQLMLTGTFLTSTFADDTITELVPCAGYSKTGVLEDSNIPTSVYPLQSLNLNLRQIAEKIFQPFGIEMIIDPAVQSRMEEKFPSSTADEDQSIKSYLSTKATQKNITISHTSEGKVLFTEAKVKNTPIAHFENGDRKYTKMRFTINGQRLHSTITIIKDADDEGGTDEHFTITNPYVKAFRPMVRKMSSGNQSNIRTAARSALGEELENLKLIIDIPSWEIGNKVIDTNQIITVINPRLGINKRTPFLIRSVEFKGDENEPVSVIECVLPDVYSQSTPVNIFE